MGNPGVVSWEQGSGRGCLAVSLPRGRGPREEVIEILTEGIWTLICQEREPACRKIPGTSDNLREHAVRKDGGFGESSSNV